MSYHKTLYLRILEKASDGSHVEISGPNPADVAELGEEVEAAVYRLVGIVKVGPVQAETKPQSMPLAEHKKGTLSGLPVLEHITDSEGDPMAAMDEPNEPTL